MPELVLHNGETPVLRVALNGASVSVGRSNANDISVPDDSVPLFYCSFEPQGQGRYRVVDRAGEGVEVKGSTWDHKDLEDGDVFALGRLRARYSVDGGADTPARREGAQRTGILRTRGDKLTRADLRLRMDGTILDIPPEGLRIGALPDNDVVIDDGFVSSFHAQVFVRGERLFVRDLDSTNGTFIGGIRVVEAEVPPGAELKLGKTRIQVEEVEADVPVEAPQEKDRGPWRCADLVTADRTFAHTFAFIEKVAPHDATVCVFGETGTGKELVAQALHRLSGRKNQPFNALNCAAFPAELIESELFGHEKGAFTGADRQRKGAFEEADKGTLFLDEIGELPIDLQAKLLRVLETRAIRRVGGRGDIPVDVRIVAATHRDLVQHVRDGKFREDLLHRIYVIPIQLPPLRARPADVVQLARHFARALSPSGREVKLSPEAERKLQGHPFPGNVRELKNVIQRALIMGDGKNIEEADVVFIPVTLAETTARAEAFRPGMTMDDIEKQALKSALDTYGSMSEAARVLGIPKTTFWRRATAFGLVARDAKPD